MNKLANSVASKPLRKAGVERFNGFCHGAPQWEGQTRIPDLQSSFFSAVEPVFPGPKRGSEMSRGMQTAAGSAKSRRISALDFTKGALVLIMVLYHWINYFIGPNWAYYRYLRFLTPSFILVTGFLISNVYLLKYSVTGWRLSRRLLTRGLKLLAMFAGLNLARLAVLPELSNVGAVAEHFNLRSIADAFVTGNVYTGTSKVVAFYILIPIGYLLIISSALVLPYRFYKRAFHATCVLLFACILTLGLNGLKSDNMEFVSIGFLGVLFGFISIEKINNLIGHPYIQAIAYACYLIAITAWNVPFPLQVVGAFLSVGAIYLVGLRGDDRGGIRRHVILLGQYSLLGYVAQIAILQLLSAGLRHTSLGPATLGISFIAAFTLTVVVVEAVDRGRARSMAVDGMYKAIFA